MSNQVTTTGKTVEEAIEKAVAELGAPNADAVSYTILEEGKKGGLFGIGAVPAKIVASYTPEVVDAPVADTVKPAETPAPVADEPKEVVAPHEITEAETAAVEFINTLVQHMNLNTTVNVSDKDDGTKLIAIEGEGAGALIGHHGETLDALQYLANLVANKREDGKKHEYTKISVDVENYRAKREETLRALARRRAEQVLKYKKSVMLEPMNPYERRIIHSEIQNIKGVSTNSIGSENNRRVVIYLGEKENKGE